MPDPRPAVRRHFPVLPVYSAAGAGVSVVAGWLTILLLWMLVWRECREKPPLARWLLPAAAALLVFSSPIFGTLAHRNHALATLFGMAAVAFALRPKTPSGPGSAGLARRWFWVGVFLGLAVGTRLTSAPLFAPLAAAAAINPAGGDTRERLRRVAVFFAGVVVALLPSLVSCDGARAISLWKFHIQFNNRTSFYGKLNTTLGPRSAHGCSTRSPISSLFDRTCSSLSSSGSWYWRR